MLRFPFKTPVITGLVVASMFACVNEQVLEPTVSTANARVAADDADFTIMRGHYILMGSNDQLPASLADDVAKAKGRIGTVMGKVGVATATSDDPDFIAKASRIQGIQAVMPDVSAQWVKPVDQVDSEELADAQSINPPTSTNSNPRFNLQWGHDAIDSPEAWQAGHKGAGVRVAVLDNGFDLDHPDLAGNIVYDKSFVPGEVAQYMIPDPFSHGTHTAGTVAALDNNIGVIGVAPSAKLLLIKVLRDSGSGAFSWIIQGILDAVEQDADIISMSLGGYMPRNGKFLNNNGTPNDPTDDFVVNDTKATQDLITTMTRIINHAHRQGVTVIAAAGNSSIDGNQNKSGMTLPGNLPNVICVSATGPLGWAKSPATTNLDLFAGYSNYGTPDITLAAPGGNGNGTVTGNCTVAGLTRVCRAFDLVFSTGNAPGTAQSYYWSAGTSMATPHVAGVAALIIGKNGGQMDPTRVLAALKASADDLGGPGRDPYYGHGRVNAHKAVMDSGQPQ
jgi:subtilisin family serine protease